ncbi:MAG: 16S rRNA (uracil(1498)-N(3))-methyltransferase [Actinophytocola sp.]|nr:16S rRNA (uracil(1498)-N(3))-methyltransferase [Actinophytocola sp.]MPZ80863.1 16S rRNA (uracil(1498)-N(3))-methyltransferase [Actinophytocola sp.]
MSDTAPVFLVDSLPSGSSFVLDGPEGRHAAAVRRLGPGEALVVSDGRGGGVACVVDSAVGKESLTLTVTRRWRDPAPRPRIVLAQALVKGDRGELAVELATETGVDSVVPWRAERSVARWDDGPRGAKALARWRSTVREAAKQSRRTWVPPVTEPVGTAGLAALVGSSALAVVLDAAAPSGLTDLDLPADGDLLLVVGPEGGISDRESATLREAGAQVARLGPTVLRASTTASAAIAALGVLTTRWR